MTCHRASTIPHLVREDRRRYLARSVELLRRALPCARGEERAPMRARLAELEAELERMAQSGPVAAGR